MRLTILLLLVFTIIQISFSQNQNISNGQVFDGEPFVAVNPQNNQHIIVAWMGFKWLNKVVIKTRFSFDGGSNWSEAVDMGHVVEGYTSADPSMSFDNSGNLFLTYIDYNKDEDVGGVYIRKSEDGGQSWGEAVLVIEMNSDPGRMAIDRPWIAIDTSGGDTNGNIYITTMNVSGAEAGYNPYLSRSFDNGQTWEQWKYIDAEDWMAGTLLKQPMPTPAVASNGKLNIVYPSWVISQNFSPQYFHAVSDDGGDSFSYNLVFESTNNVSDDKAKKGYLLRCNPVNYENMVFMFLSDVQGDADVFLVETMDAGLTWSDPIRLNDDELANGKMQDMLWASYDVDGDLIVAWRDRREAANDGYEAASGFWATVRRVDSLEFSANFRLSDSLVEYNSDLANAGNDFMCIYLKQDTLNAVWGEVREGESLNIWFQRMAIPGGVISSVSKIAHEQIIVKVYPNPVENQLFVEAEEIVAMEIFDQQGSLSKSFSFEKCNKVEVDISSLPVGIYLLKVSTTLGTASRKLIKN